MTATTHPINCDCDTCELDTLADIAELMEHPDTREGNTMANTLVEAANTLAELHADFLCVDGMIAMLRRRNRNEEADRYYNEDFVRLADAKDVQCRWIEDVFTREQADAIYTLALAS
jgi:hypothetical protein